MTTGDIILGIFCAVDDRLGTLKRHPQSKLHPSELITIGILFSLKGGHFRAFERWLRREYGTWFGDGVLPERSRLQRLLKTHHKECARFLASPTVFTVFDSYPIELIFPIREGRSDRQVGKKGRDKGRWSVGIKYGVLLNAFCQIVVWGWTTLNEPDKKFHPLFTPLIGQTIALADFGCRAKEGIPENMKLCKKGTWNERMTIETLFSMLTRVCDLKRIRHRAAEYIHARLAYVSAMVNVLGEFFHKSNPDHDPFKIKFAQFAI